ncbi:MAG: hypothetical protein AB8U25_04595 [Rickettsiales endosymbiont of Dermacentor nuttalli]
MQTKQMYYIAQGIDLSRPFSTEVNSNIIIIKELLKLGDFEIIRFSFKI